MSAILRKVEREDTFNQNEERMREDTLNQNEERTREDNLCQDHVYVEWTAKTPNAITSPQRGVPCARLRAPFTVAQAGTHPSSHLHLVNFRSLQSTRSIRSILGHSSSRLCGLCDFRNAPRHLNRNTPPRSALVALASFPPSSCASYGVQRLAPWLFAPARRRRTAPRIPSTEALPPVRFSSGLTEGVLGSRVEVLGSGA